MKIALSAPPKIQSWEVGELERISEQLAGAVELTKDMEAAERIVLLESNLFKSHHHIKELLAMPEMKIYPWKLLCVNYEDTPAGFLPGAYSSLERFRFNPQMHISWPHLRMPNEYIGEYKTNDIDPSLLFSFSGSLSHPLRQKLFDAYENVEGNYRVCHIRRWYDHNEDEKRSYIKEILKSRFVLCPRGIASYSHRILESLALGRIPVVIADDWVPFSIGRDDYYIRIPENRIKEVASILEEHNEDYDRIAANVREVYATYFNPSVAYPKLIEALLKIDLDPSFSREFFEKKWKSFSFYRKNGWGLEQRIWRKLKKLFSRFFVG